MMGEPSASISAAPGVTWWLRLRMDKLGMGAHESMKTWGIRPVLTDFVVIDEALKIYIEGRMIDQVERLH